jgi:hypothetical protein
MMEEETQQTQQNLVGLIELLRVHRTQDKLRTQEADEAWKKVEASAEYQEWVAADKKRLEAQTLMIDDEGTIRMASEIIFRETGNKEPAQGVKIRVMKHLAYDKSACANWIKVSAPALLTPDWKSFEKVAVKMGAPVAEIEEGKAFIASEL